MRKVRFAFFVVLVGIFLTACGGDMAPSGDPLEGTSWKLVFYRKSQVMDGADITASFSEGQVNGSAGCNSYFGAYTIKGGEITFEQLGSTEMFCMEPDGIMDFEQMYLAWLMDAQTYRLTDDQLMIFRSDGEALTFVPQE